MTDLEREIEALRDYNKQLKARVEYLESLNAESEDIDAIAEDFRKYGYINNEPAHSWCVDVISRQYKTVDALRTIASCDHNGIVTSTMQAAESHGLKVWPREKELRELNKWLLGIVGSCAQ